MNWLERSEANHRENGLQDDDWQRFIKFSQKQLTKLRKQCGIRHTYGDNNGKKKKSKQPKEPNQSSNVHGKNLLLADISEKLAQPEQPANALIELLLMESERAWAQSMHFKVQQERSAETAVTLKPRQSRHGMLKKLARALQYAKSGLELMHQHSALFSQLDLVEVQCYFNLIRSFALFEQKHDWAECLKALLSVQWLYSQLAALSPSDSYRKFIAGRIEELQPYLRFCSYQLVSEGEDPTGIAEQDFVSAEMQQSIEKLKGSGPEVWLVVSNNDPLEHQNDAEKKLDHSKSTDKQSSGKDAVLSSIHELKSALEKALPEGTQIPKKKNQLKQHPHLMSLESELRPLPYKPILYDQAYYGIFDSLPADITSTSTEKQQQQQESGGSITNLLSSFFGR